MASLIAKSPLAGHAPVSMAGVTLSEIVLDRMTSIQPREGQEKAVAKALKPLGLRFPAPNSSQVAGDARMVWTGRGQAFLIGVAVPDGLEAVAAVTDQSDGWAALQLDGPGVEDVLARLVPVDTRVTAFAVDRAVRVPFNHMSSVLIRTGEARFMVLVFRSMARTAWHEAETAMTMLAARAARV